MIRRVRPGLGSVLTLGILMMLAGYFTYAAINGNFGVLRRAEVAAEARLLIEERDALLAEVARLENLTRRLSDEFLDLDLLDEQARRMLGFIRTDEIVIR
ncbi:MAG: septum formation initiator family protein [Rubellimicrobium sp.]|nr:septum formation initiator family protein [Rubellimicrobium sp.]